MRSDFYRGNITLLQPRGGLGNKAKGKKQPTKS